MKYSTRILCNNPVSKYISYVCKLYYNSNLFVFKLYYNYILFNIIIYKCIIVT